MSSQTSPQSLEALSQLVAVLRMATVEDMHAYAAVCRESSLERLDAIPSDVAPEFVTGAEWVGRITAHLAEVLDSLANDKAGR